MSINKLVMRPDRKISALCHRGSHEGIDAKNTCKGRSCACDCHPINKKLPYCIICDTRRTDKENQKCRYCTGEVSDES